MGFVMPLDNLPLDTGRPCFRFVHRYSSARQGLGESLWRQAGEGETTAEALAERFGLPVGPPITSKGVSAFRGKNLVVGEFAEWLQEVHAGRVPRGTIIGLDEWSRLTRMELDKSSHLLTGLISRGIGIYIRKTNTLINQAEVRGHAGFMNLSMALMHLQLSRMESEGRSIYTRKTTAKRHADAAAEGVIRTRQTPGWLEVVGGSFKEALKAGVRRKFLELPGPCYVVRRVYREARYQGALAIAEGLNRDWKAGDERCAPFGLERAAGSAGWHSAAVSKLLRNPAVYGLVQRTTVEMESGAYAKLPGEEYLLYPEIICRKEFDAVQEEINGRLSRKVDADGKRRGRGGRTGHMPNVFSGLCVCVACNGPVTYYTVNPGPLKRGKRTTLTFPQIRCRSAKLGTGCRAKPQAYRPLEDAILTALAEMPVDSVMPRQAAESSAAERELGTLLTRLDFITRRIAKFAEIEDEDEQEALRPKLKEWGAEKRDIEARRIALQRIIDAEHGEDGAGERLMTVKRLRAVACGPDGPVRIMARKQLNLALTGVVQRVAILADRAAVVNLANGHHQILVSDGRASVLDLGGVDLLDRTDTEKMAKHAETAARLGAAVQPIANQMPVGPRRAPPPPHLPMPASMLPPNLPTAEEVDQAIAIKRLIVSGGFT